MASGNGHTDHLVVQVSVFETFAGCVLLLTQLSFLVKDAQQDIAGERLKA